MANHKARGTQRERAVKEDYVEKDWLAFRAPASLGCADVVAVRKGTVWAPTLGAPLSEVHLVEVKANLGNPYMNFRPAERKRLIEAAAKCGASALLAWWPPRGKLQYIPESEWP